MVRESFFWVVGKVQGGRLAVEEVSWRQSSNLMIRWSVREGYSGWAVSDTRFKNYVLTWG